MTEKLRLESPQFPEAGGWAVGAVTQTETGLALAHGQATHGSQELSHAHADPSFQAVSGTTTAHDLLSSGWFAAGSLGLGGRGTREWEIFNKPNKGFDDLCVPGNFGRRQAAGSRSRAYLSRACCRPFEGQDGLGSGNVPD